MASQEAADVTVASSAPAAKKASQKNARRRDRQPKVAKEVKDAPGETAGSSKQPHASASNASSIEQASEAHPSSAKKPQTSKKTEPQRKKKGGKVAKSKKKVGTDGSAKPKLKVIVRRLPPNLPESIFWKSVGPWITLPPSRHETTSQSDSAQTVTVGSHQATLESTTPNVDAYYFVAGKLKDRSRRGVAEANGSAQHTYSRAYIRFRDADSLVRFHQGFDGHLFRDAKGNEYWAVVEFAPFEMMPTDAIRRKKKDTLVGTIESDAHYQAFISSQDKKNGDGRSEAQLMAQLNTTGTDQAAHIEQAKHTPLLEHLRAQRAAKLGHSQKSRGSKGGNAGGKGSGKDKLSKGKDSATKTKKLVSKGDGTQKGAKKGAKGDKESHQSDKATPTQSTTRNAGARSKKKSQPDKNAAPGATVSILTKESQGKIQPPQGKAATDHKQTSAQHLARQRDKGSAHSRDTGKKKADG